MSRLTCYVPVGLNGGLLINSYLQKQFTKASYGITGSTAKETHQRNSQKKLFILWKAYMPSLCLLETYIKKKAANSGRAL